NRRDFGRKRNTEAPAGDVHLMDALVAHVAVAGVPKPVPVVVEAILGERLHGRGTRPKIVVHARGNRLDRGASDGVAPLVAQAARQVDLAQQPVLDSLHAFHHTDTGAALRAVLDDAVVFLRGAHQLLSFPPVVRARLLNVDVLAGLAAPDGHQRVPVVGRRNGDGVDRLIFQELSHVGAGLGLGQALLLHLLHTVPYHVFIDVADRGNFSGRNLRV